MVDSELGRTRRGLHAVAELVIAGPQHRVHGTIRLRVTSTGFRGYAEPDPYVDGTDLVVGSARIPISGATARDLAEAAGRTAGAPEGVYEDGSGIRPGDALVVEAAAARRIQQAMTMGDAAMRAFDRTAEPVLWPEHFDVGIRVDGMNYGVSPGDGLIDEPYAYVGVEAVPVDAFWNAPFGATRPMTALPDVDAVFEFFTAARSRIR